VQTHQIIISQGRDRVNEVRGELLNFPEILDVFVTGRADSLVVVCSGRPRPAEWLRALRAVGFTVPARPRASVPRRTVELAEAAIDVVAPAQAAQVSGTQARPRAGTGQRHLAKRVAARRSIRRPSTLTEQVR
jgi:hypothetical protein